MTVIGPPTGKDRCDVLDGQVVLWVAGWGGDRISSHAIATSGGLTPGARGGEGRELAEGEKSLCKNSRNLHK